jgi:prolipoprotein diacylglyceryltransferase
MQVRFLVHWANKVLAGAIFVAFSGGYGLGAFILEGAREVNLCFGDKSAFPTGVKNEADCRN